MWFALKPIGLVLVNDPFLIIFTSLFTTFTLPVLFFYQIGYWPWYLVTFGRRNMEWNPCSIYLKKYIMCDRNGLFVAAMKLSTKTSTKFAYLTDAVSLCIGFYVWSAIIFYSKGCSGWFNSCNSVSITYLAVHDDV